MRTAAALSLVMEAPDYKTAIDKAKKRYPSLAVTIDTQECFAVMWRDGMGVCPLDGVNGELCDIRKQCQEAFEQANAVDEEPVLFPVLEPALKEVKEHKPKPLGRPKKKNPFVSPTPRGKWSGSGKWERFGYTPGNRPVDQALAALVTALGNPAILPTRWSPMKFHEKYSHLGRIVLSQSSSYTSVLVDGATVLRFWTNASSCALVDIIQPLVRVISTIKGCGRVIQVPQGSEKKLAPCTHRFQLTFGATKHTETLSIIGAMIRMAYRATPETQGVV